MELNFIEQKCLKFNKKKFIRQLPNTSTCKKKCYGYNKFDYITKNCCSKNKIQ